MQVRLPTPNVSQDERRKMMLGKADGARGHWTAALPRNDPLCCSYGPHVLLANLGNIDWRPCLHLWAVVEHIAKYATKAAKGSRHLGEVLRDAVDEVCRYTGEGSGIDLLRRSLQKFYARTVGERDYTIFEAVQLGLSLPMMIPCMPVVGLNTLGTRSMKTSAQLRGADEEEPATWDGKVDKFDRRKY